MFLEKSGKFFFSQMRPVFFFALCALPLLSSVLFLSFEFTQLQELEERFASAARKEKISLGKKQRKERFLERYSQVDPYFLDHKIESFLLLQKERQRLESLLHHSAFPGSPLVQERLAFLNENKFSFAEENLQLSKEVKEVDEKQRHPVQMDEEDLKQILSLIENVSIDEAISSNESPQILIKNFHLKKQRTPLQTEVFEIEMDLLKREFIK